MSIKLLKCITLAVLFAIAGCDSKSGRLLCAGDSCESTDDTGNSTDNNGAGNPSVDGDNENTAPDEESTPSDTNNNEQSTDNNSGDNDTGESTPDNGEGDAETPENNGDGDNTTQNPSPQPGASGISLRHRSGQTFITWDEPQPDAQYHVYRSGQPITTDNLADATLLTWRWGPLDADTSRNKYAVSDVPEYFVIENQGAPLPDSTGLFVHTATENTTAYYAITTLVDGVENPAIVQGRNTAMVSEFIATPQPVLTLSVNGGKGRLYTHFMDYQQWNPTLNGYAFNYFVALPFNYNPSQSYPLQIELHAYGYYPALPQQVPYQWQVIQLIPLDPGDDRNTYHTWWYGHARDHDYINNGNTPFSGAIENFTEQRVMKAMQETIDNAGLSINTDLIHAYGNSMGASGSVSLALRYANRLSAVYASQPMMDYRNSSRFRFNFERLFGPVENNLPIVNRGLYAGSIQRYGEGGNQPTGVWDWMDHHAQVQRRRGDDFAYLMIDFGKADDIIDWQTQGRPTFAALADARVAFAATAREGVGHEWRAFDSVNQSLYPFEFGQWRYPNALSYPAFNFASGSGRLDPPTSGDDEYQTSLEWSTPQYGFGQSIVDQNNRYEITVRSVSSEQRVDVTPRNTQAFRPAGGTVCSWSARNVNNGSTETGTLTVDGNRLATVPQISVAVAGGTRLTIDCS